MVLQGKISGGSFYMSQAIPFLVVPEAIMSVKGFESKGPTNLYFEEYTERLEENFLANEIDDDD